MSGQRSRCSIGRCGGPTLRKSIASRTILTRCSTNRPNHVVWSHDPVDDKVRVVVAPGAPDEWLACETTTLARTARSLQSTSRASRRRRRAVRPTVMIWSRFCGFGLGRFDVLLVIVFVLFMCIVNVCCV